MDTDKSVAELAERVRPERLARLASVVDRRMKGLTVVLDNLYDRGNQAAVLRTAEAFGLLRVHIVNPVAARKVNPRQVSRGTEKWLDVHRHDDAGACVRALREGGYRILVTDLAATQTIDEVDFSVPTALVFGNEHDGVTSELKKAADGGFIIPMRGFVQSFNISVAAALAISAGRARREAALGAQTDLDPAEAEELLRQYLLETHSWVRERTGRKRWMPNLGDKAELARQAIAAERGHD